MLRSGQDLQLCMVKRIRKDPHLGSSGQARGKLGASSGQARGKLGARWSRCSGQVVCGVFHRHSESTEYTVLHTLRRCKDNNQINCLSHNARISTICIKVKTVCGYTT